ncbi:MAG: hypothetical protein ACOWWH_14115 [Eubacteriaceae bacterium]
MEKQHILIEKAFIYNSPNFYQIKKVPRQYKYDKISGYWIKFNNRDAPAITDSTFSKPITKKHDIETGEDQKGE